MKKSKILKCVCFFVSALIVWYIAVAFQLNQSEYFFTFKFDGAWVPSVDPLAVGPNNYTTLKNFRYKDGGYLETVEGYSKITSSTVAASGTPVNLHQFAKNDDETHVIVKMNDVSGSSYLYENTTAIPSTGDFGSSIYTVSNNGIGSFANGPAGTLFYADDQYDLVWGGDEMRVARMFKGESAGVEVELEEYTSNINNDSESDYAPISASGSYLYVYICSALRLDGIKIYLETANSTSATSVSVSFWKNGAAYSAVGSLVDNTESGGYTLAVDGTMTWDYDSTAVPRYINGGVYFVYRLSFNTAVVANIYKITASAPLQPIQDVWNRSGRTCIAFQANRNGVYEDWTFPVNDYSTTDTPYAAKIGGIDNDDTMYVMFDDRIMGLDITMLAGATNQASVKIDEIRYFDGDSYVAVGDMFDLTGDGSTTSFEKSGTIFWDPEDADDEHAQSAFGRYGYVYEIDLDGTLTDGTDHDGTQVDFIYGIAAPLKMTGYNVVGQYSGRAVLFDRNRMDYSRAGLPWVFNGVDTSNDRELSLYFGEETPVVAVASLYNRYGSRTVEQLIVGKKTETYLLSGSQPYSDYAEPFIVKKVSSNIGMPAPKTLCVVDIGSEVAQGDWRNGAIWLDSTGPVMFAGETIVRLDGLEIYFDQELSTAIKLSKIHEACAYVDWKNKEYNLSIPIGSGAGSNNTWVVYDLKRRKWYKKSASWPPQAATTVVDEYGEKYNYAVCYDRHMRYLDHTQTYDSSAIDQQITTGEFMIPTSPKDNTGFWMFNELTAIKWLSNDLDEDENLTIGIDYDGSNHSPDLVIDLNADGNLNYVRNLNAVRRVGAQGHTFQIDFSASSDTNKLKALMWGFKAKAIRED